MARPRKALADRLERVAAEAVDGVVRSSRISDGDRRMLVAEGWLSPICRGWYLLHTPGGRDGDSTVWFGSIYTFVAQYLSSRFGEGWCMSAAHSLAVHTGDTRVPRQLTAITGSGGAMTLELPHDTSLLMYPDPRRLPTEVDVVEGLRLMNVSEALSRVSLSWFRSNDTDAAVALRTVRASEVVRAALARGYLDGLGRLIGAWRTIGLQREAEEATAALELAGHSVAETNPFERAVPQVRSRPGSPHVGRIEEVWARMRDAVLEEWETHTLHVGPTSYLADLDVQAERDAWHSLSIEGYKVTPELIKAVREGAEALEDASQRDTLAAVGYMRAHKAVRETVSGVLAGEPLANLRSAAVPLWYRRMFSPHVDAGLVKAHQLIGFRQHPVYIKGSRHVPPRYAAVPDAIDALFELLAGEEEASVRAVLGHFVFTWVHPYADGNGRLGRFLMNVEFASGGIPWTVIRTENRSRYMQALELASVEGDISPFAAFVRAESEARQDVT